MSDRIYYSSEAEQRVKRNHTLSVAVFTAMGIVAGAVIALLFAPKSGETFRREISETAERTLESGREAAEKVIESVNNHQ